MKLSEAIVGLEDLLVEDPHFDPERRREAIKLGIEALKRFQQQRQDRHSVGFWKLPGETED